MKPWLSCYLLTMLCLVVISDQGCGWGGGFNPPTFSQTTSPVGPNTGVGRKLETCVFCMSLPGIPTTTLSSSTALHSHAANKCYDVLSKAGVKSNIQQANLN